MASAGRLCQPVPASPTSTLPAVPAATRVVNFCLKAISQDKPNYGFHTNLNSGSATEYLVEPSFNDHYNDYTLDTTTGVIRHSAIEDDLQLYAPAPYGEGSPDRPVMSGKAPPSAAPLLCSNPDGQYTRGSLLRCTATGHGASGQSYTYDHFTYDPTTQLWAIGLEGVTSNGKYSYDIGIFFGGADCIYDNGR
ncbi:hypothetical protein G7Z17_g12162 [Cylindrodendrum hubeiense]|uniref:Uncharacterized protein n=1 Tax=Cylindrodendrum hubeiense TaxID=595255 RepID=A0A9P5GW38_9HYPO|nr:hypothetical protein G7Z17_g12162 [Cylindrodendrum hubeiense]